MSPENSAQEHPLVSIICRSIGRPELNQALRSVAAQNYPNLEIVLIDAAAKGLGDAAPQCGNVPLVLISDGKQYSRSQAANAGLNAATGEYLLLLDDDDWIASTHIENLVTCLQTQTDLLAAYSNTQKTDSKGVLLEYVFKDDFDPVLLMRDNYIPIHAMLFHRSLLRKQCRFDEAFDIYEDWDFWLQLSQHTAFAHVDEVTAFYREGGESETAAADVSSRYTADSLLGKGRAALFNKWMPHWNGAQLNQLIGSLDKSQTLRQLADELHNARISLDASILEKHTLESANSQLQDKLDHADLQLSDRNRHITQLEQHTANLEQHAVNLERHAKELADILQGIHQSLSWKLMGPFRRISRSIQSRTDDKQNEDQ